MSRLRLSSLEVGQTGRIAEIPSGSETLQRLQDLGLIAGELVRVLKKAPFGDPIEIRVMNYDLCIRKREAAFVQVDL